MGKPLIFTDEMKDALRRHWVNHTEAYATVDAMKAEGFDLTVSQVINGAARYCRKPVVSSVVPLIVKMGFGPEPRPDNARKFVKPGTHKAPIGGFSMIRGR